MNRVLLIIVLVFLSACKDDSTATIGLDEVEARATTSKAITLPDTNAEVTPIPLPPSPKGMSPQCEELKKELVEILNLLISNSADDSVWTRYEKIYDSETHTECLKKFQQYRDEIETLEERIE